MKKKLIYSGVIALVVAGLIVAGIHIFGPVKKNKLLDPVTLKVGTMYSGKQLMADLAFTNMSFSTHDEKIAQVSYGTINGMIMPIEEGSTKIVLKGTYKNETYTRVLPVSVKNESGVKVGCDISAWNTAFDADKVKDYNLDFVMLRLGVSSDVDRLSRLKAIALKKAGVGMGAYWYLASEDRQSLVSVKEAEKQAKMFVRMLNNMEGRTMEYPVFLDLESMTLIHQKDAVGYLEKIVQSFVSILQKAGYKNVGIYANRNFLVNYLTSDYYKSFDKVWYARYGYAKSGPYSDGSRAYLWQTGDHYKSAVVGHKHLDLDYMYTAH